MGWEGLHGKKPPKAVNMVRFWERQVKPAMKAISKAAGESTVKHTVANTPIDEAGPHPGKLRKSVKMRKIEIWNAAGMVIYETGAETAVDYAPYVELGTGLWGPKHAKYLIAPKTPGGLLHWVDRNTGKDIFARWVWHPGSPGQFMFVIGVDMAGHDFPRTSAAAVADFVKKCESYRDTGSKSGIATQYLEKVT